ncbi:hypothetical protein GCM10009554_57490 [Kribbella koreensis]|uniref:ATP/GTP-binding protein n=1 Tax=Kribbella koreensis TaxID=57909 RepID=A0ABN1RAB2_9ACTN
MLIPRARFAAFTVLAAIISGVCAMLPAAATAPIPPGYVMQCDKTTHICVLVASSSIPVTGGKDTKTGSKGHQKRICQFNGGAQACTDPLLGNWSNSQQCYLQSMDQPPLSDPAWGGHTDGAIWACVREQGYNLGRHLVTKWVWLPGPPDTVVTDPLTLAYEAIAKMQLAKPQVRSAPGVGEVGLVNMPVWLWVERSESTYGPITRFAEVPGLRVTATGVVKAIDWKMGDGKTVRCEGAGTPYSKAKGINDSPDCGYRYRKTSHSQPNCQYPVSATAQWSITWESTLGDTGQIDMTQQATTQLRIGEAVPVLVDPGGGQPTVESPDNC